MIFLVVNFRIRMPVYNGFIVIGKDSANNTPVVLNAITDTVSNVLTFVQDFTDISGYNSNMGTANKIEYRTTGYNQLVAAMPTYQTVGPSGTNNSSLLFTNGSTSSWSDTSGVAGFDTFGANDTTAQIIMRNGYFDGSDNTVVVGVNYGSASNVILYNKGDITNTWSNSSSSFGPASNTAIRTIANRSGNDKWIVVGNGDYGAGQSLNISYKDGISSDSFSPSSGFNSNWLALSGVMASGFGKVGPSALDGWLIAGNANISSDSSNNSLVYTNSIDGSGGWIGYGTDIFKVSGTRWNPRCMATDGGGQWVIGYTAGMTTGVNPVGIIYSNNNAQTFVDCSFNVFGFPVPPENVANYTYACYGLAYGNVDGQNYFVATGMLYDNDLSIYLPNYSILQSIDGINWSPSNIPGGFNLGNNGTDDVIYTQMDVVCLLKGSKIKTPEGYVAIETLKPGDTILMPNGLEREIVEVPRQTVPNELHLAPYIIPAGKLGATEDLYISPTHSVFIDGKFIEAQFLGYKRASLPDRTIEYYNISLGGFRDELLDAQGVTIESLGKPFKGTEKGVVQGKVSVRKDLSKDSIYPEDVRNGLIAKLQQETAFSVSELQGFSDQELRYILLGDYVDNL